MRIALISQWYPPETGGGGIATHNYHFANACARLGHDITVISSQGANGSGRTGGSASDCMQNGVRVIRVPEISLYRYRRLPLVGGQLRFLQALIYSRRVCAELERLEREQPFDIAEFADVNAEGFFWREGLGKRLVVRCQTPNFVLARYYTREELAFNARWLGWAERRTIRRADLLGAPSYDMAQVVGEACGLPVEQFHVTPDALDTDHFHPKPRPPSDTVTILFVGRLERAKGIDTLIETIPAVCDANANVRFVLVGGSRPRPGGGTSVDHLKRALAPYLERGQVVLKGFVPDEALVSLYHAADITVVPSLLYESFSFTCAQAMACGVPVVASRVGGIPETLAHGACGVLVTPGSSAELTAALNSLIHDPARRRQLGQAAREHVVRHFSADAVASAILDSYAQALGRE